MHTFDEELRAVYNWYATLDDPRVLPWHQIVDFKASVTPDQCMLMLLNFKVRPRRCARTPLARSPWVLSYCACASVLCVCVSPVAHPSS